MRKTKKDDNKAQRARREPEQKLCVLRDSVPPCEIFIRNSTKKIVSTLSTHLTWSHIIELLPLQIPQAKLFYANEAVEQSLGVRELRHLIERKTYERSKIANKQLQEINL